MIIMNHTQINSTNRSTTNLNRNNFFLTGINIALFVTSSFLELFWIMYQCSLAGNRCQVYAAEYDPFPA